MRFAEIYRMLENYFFLALIIVLVFALVFIILRKSNHSLQISKLLIYCLLIGYLIMVIGVTFLNRGSESFGGINLTPFSSYKEAWYQFDVRHFQFVILNICMFIPLGILLPFVHRSFRRIYWTLGAGLLCTLFIECFQLITKFGMFELDDIFNNVLGTLIGYCLVMMIVSLKEKKVKRFFAYISPILVVILSFVSMLVVYEMKEFGNLNFMPIHKNDLSKSEITYLMDVRDQRTKAIVYKAPNYSKSQADQFVEQFLDAPASDMEIIRYDRETVYWLHGEPGYNIWFDHLDGSYNYSDFSSFDEIQPIDGEIEKIEAQLANMNILVPNEATLEKRETGVYVWTVNQERKGHHLLDGTLQITYYEDDTIKDVNNQLVIYEKVKDVDIKSEQEALDELLKGNFAYDSITTSINTIEIQEISLRYYLDTKGFYQPVYEFTSIINGEQRIIMIPAI